MNQLRLIYSTFPVLSLLGGALLLLLSGCERTEEPLAEFRMGDPAQETEDTQPSANAPSDESDTTAQQTTAESASYNAAYADKEYPPFFEGWEKPALTLYFTGRQHGYIEPVVAQNSASQASVAAALPAEISWKNLTNLFKEHHLMTTAELRRHDLSPFGRSNREDVTTDKNQEDESGQETETSKSPEVQRPTLKELGLELTSTATGGGMQLAVINGKTCEVDSVLVIPYRDMEIELKLVEVRPDVVALSDGKEVQLLARNDTETRMQLGAAMTMHSIPGLATPDRILIDSGRTD